MTTNDPTAALAARPTRRNALLTWLIPVLIFMLTFPAGNYLGTTSLSFLVSLPNSISVIITLLYTFGMVRELNAAAGTTVKFWHIAIPFYNLYWLAVVVPGAMAIAKQKAGKPAPRGAVVYLFLFLYAFAADLNDLAD